MFMANLSDAMGYCDQSPAICKGFLSVILSQLVSFHPLGITSFAAAAYSVRSATMERPTPDQVWMIGPSLPVGDWIQIPTVFPPRMTFLTPS